MKLIWNVDPWKTVSWPVVHSCPWVCTLPFSAIDVTWLVHYALCVLSFQGDHTDPEAGQSPTLDPDGECISLMACSVPHSIAGRSWEFLTLTRVRCSHVWVDRPKAEKSDWWKNRKFLLRVRRVCGYQCSPVVQNEGHALRSPPWHRPWWT